MRLGIAAAFLVLLGVAGLVRLALFIHRGRPAEPGLRELPSHREPALDLRSMVGRRP